MKKCRVCGENSFWVNEGLTWGASIDENENNIKIFLNDYKKPTHLNCKFSCVKEK